LLRSRGGGPLAGELDGLWPTPRPAEGIGAHALQDRLQPGPRVRAGGEAVEGPVSAQEGLLHDVLGVVGVSGHAVRGREERPQVGQHFRFESLVAAQIAPFRRTLFSEGTPAGLKLFRGCHSHTDAPA
jgi:hypothetical protein